MLDCPDLNHDLGYVENVMTPLAKGDGVACFLTRDTSKDGELVVLFFSHRLRGPLGAASGDADARRRVRAACFVQWQARGLVAREGFEAVIA